MKFVTDLSKGILGNADSADLWNEIINHIPNEVLLRPGVRILNIACGHGTEARIVATRMMALGISKEEVNKSIYLIDKYRVFTSQVKTYGFKNVVTADFLTWKTDMKFDVVLGNPPYSSGLWKKFLYHSIQLATEHVVIVAPDGVTQYSNSKKSDNLKKLLITGGIQRICSVTGYFPDITSGEISAFFLNVQKESNLGAFIKVGIQHNIVSKVLGHSGAKLLPILANQIPNYGQLEKSIIPTDGFVQALSSVTASGSYEYIWINNYKNKIINGNNYWFSNRFFGSSQSMALVELNENIMIGQNILAIRKIPGYSVEQFKKIYSSPLMLFVLNVIKNGKFDTPLSAIKMLPVIPVGVSLSEFFNLTQEEIDYVDANVK